MRKTISIEVLIIKAIFIHSFVIVPASTLPKSRLDFQHKVAVDVDNGLINVTSQDVGEENLKLSLSVKIPAGLFQYEKPLNLKRAGGSFILTSPHNAHTYSSSGQVQLNHVSIDYSIKSFYNSEEHCFSLFFHAKKKEEEEEHRHPKFANQKASQMCKDNNQQPMQTNGKLMTNKRRKRKMKNGIFATSGRLKNTSA